MNTMETTLPAIIMALAFCVYAYKTAGILGLLIGIIPAGALTIAAAFLSMVDCGLYRLLMTTLVCGFAVFSLCEPRIRPLPFIFATLLSAFAFMFGGAMVSGCFSAFWTDAVVSLIAAAALISGFFGIFILFLRRHRFDLRKSCRLHRLLTQTDRLSV